MAEVRSMYLMSKALRTVILPSLTVAFTDAQVLPTDGANCKVTICSPSLNYMRSWSYEPNTINL